MLVIVSIEGVCVIALGVMMISLLRGYGEVLTSIADLRRSGTGARNLSPLLASPRTVATDVHDVVGHMVDGRAVKIAVSNRDQNTLLAFLSSGCLTCKTFWDALRDPLNRRAVGAEVVIVTKDANEESPTTIENLVPPNVRTVLSTSTWHDYEVPGSPYFMFIDGKKNRVTGEGSAVSWDQVLSMMSQSRADSENNLALQARAPVIGDQDEFVESILLEAGIGPDHPSLWNGIPPSSPHETDSTTVENSG